MIIIMIGKNLLNLRLPYTNFHGLSRSVDPSHSTRYTARPLFYFTPSVCPISNIMLSLFATLLTYFLTRRLSSIVSREPVSLFMLRHSFI